MTEREGPLDRIQPRLGLGTVAFLPERAAAATAVLDAWVALGGRLIDTAARYGYGESERIIGNWLRANGGRDELILLTKGGHPDPAWNSRLDRASVGTDLSASLELLGVDRVDIYMVHRDDPGLPVAEIVDLLNEHVAAGTITWLGASNWMPARVDQANAYAADRGLAGFAVVSNYLGLAEPTRPFMPGCVSANEPALRAWHERTGIPLVAWSPQGQGYFADDYDPARADPDAVATYDSPANRERRERAVQLARRRGRSAAQVALAWVLSQPFAPYAVVGVRTPEHLHAAWATATDLTLTAEELAWLERGGA